MLPKGWKKAVIGKVGHVERFKPGVNRSVHLFAAPLLWTVIGTMLIGRGWHWLSPGSTLLCAGAAAVAGTLKSRYVLDRVARKSVDRLVRFRDGTCLGAVYSWRTWLMVFLMMASGITLRRLTEPGSAIGTLYMAVGWSLLLSSRFGWRAWFREIAV